MNVIPVTAAAFWKRTIWFYYYINFNVVLILSYINTAVHYSSVVLVAVLHMVGIDNSLELLLLPSLVQGAVPLLEDPSRQ